ncbi:cysteine proteinase [Ascobolus immersus RN42]|uniref:Cysteine proteinase n=1 Tax=Ascobolus immersus RN42 TaxID=1160509 RepID=A0A3N4IFE9_ASCIM|nr:cysteine proteinase [Ascobolus immersus RN42]
MAEETILHYHDVALTTEDLRALRGDWLTDNNISFWEEVLEHEDLKRYPGVKIILLRPSMVMLMRQVEDESMIISALPDLRKASHIFLPINDCDDPREAEGGSHWSLLVVGVRDGVAFHYDSLMPSNDNVAKTVAAKLFHILGRTSGWRYLQVPDTPQQINGSDCGVHVCMNMEELLYRLLQVNVDSNVDMKMKGSKQNAREFRIRMERKLLQERAQA